MSRISISPLPQSRRPHSRDKDLLDLLTGHSDHYKEFRQRFRSLKILAPQAAINLFATPIHKTANG
ncbi:MAG: hypothetical protein HY231_08085 [Acidobacteria bacterium]|nr:hypothetical protein [Acidobacteriota bacterium]